MKASVSEEIEVSSKAFDQVLGQLEAQSYRGSAAHVLGIAGCTSGDGASFIMAALSAALAGRLTEKVLMVSIAELLACSHLLPANLLSTCYRSTVSGVWRLACPHDSLHHAKPSGDVDAAVAVLATKYRFILIDCGALIGPSDLWTISSVLDDLLLVVKADSTSRAQITYAQRLVEKHGVQLAGFILNRRTYPLPLWLHRVFA